MKISVNGLELFELTEIQKKVIKNDLHEDQFEDDMKRRVQYVLTHKYEQCFMRLEREWREKLSKRYSSLPTDRDALANLIFSQPDYLDRKSREIPR